MERILGACSGLASPVFACPHGHGPEHAGIRLPGDSPQAGSLVPPPRQRAAAAHGAGSFGHDEIAPLYQAQQGRWHPDPGSGETPPQHLRNSPGTPSPVSPHRLVGEAG